MAAGPAAGFRPASQTVAVVGSGASRRVEELSWRLGCAAAPLATARAFWPQIYLTGPPAAMVSSEISADFVSSVAVYHPAYCFDRWDVPKTNVERVKIKQDA